MSRTKRHKNCRPCGRSCSRCYPKQNKIETAQTQHARLSEKEQRTEVAR